VTNLGILLVIGGFALIAVAVWMGRAPLATIRHLDATAANLKRYDDWRGGRRTIDDDGPTGADEMRAQMRQRLVLWAAVGIAGAVLMVIGLLQR
jgi:hypothetical protein